MGPPPPPPVNNAPDPFRHPMGVQLSSFNSLNPPLGESTFGYRINFWPKNSIYWFSHRYLGWSPMRCGPTSWGEKESCPASGRCLALCLLFSCVSFSHP